MAGLSWLASVGCGRYLVATGLGMGIEARALTLIDGIYAAAAEPWHWGKLVDLWRAEFRAKQVFFAYLDLERVEAGIDMAVGVDAAGAERFARHSGQNPFLRAGTTALRVGEVVHDGMVLADDELKQSAYYRDVLAPEGVLYTCGPVLSRQGSRLNLLIARRDPRAGPFTAEELELQRRLVPHLQRALRMRWRLLGAEGRTAGLLEAIGSLETAVLLLNSRGEVIDLNRPARRILDRHDGLGLGRHGEILVERGVGDSSLAPLISAAPPTAAQAGGRTGGVITVVRRGRRAPYSLLVAPIRDREFAPEHERPVAAVFITDPDAAAEPSIEQLRGLYGLTPAETALALRLTEGQSVSAAAAELGVSQNTVRTHLKRLFSKTGTKRQGELVSLLLRGNPRISA